MRAPSGAAIALVVLLLLLGASVPIVRAASPLPSSASLGLSLGSDGNLSVSVTTVVPNGSPLRDAMDGNFSVLLTLLPINSSEAAAAEATIDELEDNPFTAGDFGVHLGSVDEYEVTQFEALIDRESSLVPGGIVSDSALRSSTLDGVVPTASALAGVTFEGAVGPDSSTAPITVNVASWETFPISGTTHVLTLGAPSLPFGLPLAVGLNFSFSTPPGETITRVLGATTAAISNDPWGWGSATATGTLSPMTNSSMTIYFQASTPWGTYALVGVVALLAVAVAGVVLWRRRVRWRRTQPGPWSGPAPPPAPPPASPPPGS